MTPPTPSSATVADASRLPLDEQLAAFQRSRFLAMPIAGAIAWTAIGIAGFLLPLREAIWALFLGTGAIFYLGLGIARLTGEDLLGRRQKGNYFDTQFLLSVGSALLVYGIAIPFFLVEPTSLPLSVGILTGLMWVPFAGLLRHWVGLFHGVSRTVLVVVVWYALPHARFVAVPVVIVAIYLVTIAVLVRRAARARVGAEGTMST
ncbi:MAG: hypothetical protein MUF00_10825 [Gemmatimonadaceae bacterium]|nr:hypothetical protein [Gemmatimonadaceae bacterium]